MRFLGITGKSFLAIMEDPAHSQHGLGICIIAGLAQPLGDPHQLYSRPFQVGGEAL
ncbi:hypothetical protein D3C80_2006070 [compost metagenome]